MLGLVVKFGLLPTAYFFFLQLVRFTPLPGQVCISKRMTREAAKYIPRVASDEARATFYMEVAMYGDAAETAFGVGGQRAVELLEMIEQRCGDDHATLRQVRTMIARLTT